MARKTRTFVAVAASSEVRGRAGQAIDRLRTIAENVKWVAQENLHWTLQFLGDVDDAELVEVCRRVVDTAARHKPFFLSGEGVSAFPTSSRPRTLWLGAGQGSDALCELQSAIEQSLAELGFRGERRKFVPHLTLGRVGRGSHGGQPLAARLAELAAFEGGAMSVEEVTVFASQLERDGPTYLTLARAPLSGLG